MKLWEIKAQALRLMFVDTDIEFSEQDFKDKVVYSNANTREKLVRMDDTIRRAIDLYYQFNGEISQVTLLSFDIDHYEDDEGNVVVPAEGEEENYNAIYKTIIPTSGISNFGYPTRIDVVRNAEEGIKGAIQISYDFDNITKELSFPDYDFSYYADAIQFRVYFKIAKMNLPYVGLDEMTFDLNTLFIEEDIQRIIPKFVKGELYEEDEYGVAEASQSEFIQYLQINQRQQFRKSRNKVRVKVSRANNRQ